MPNYPEPYYYDPEIEPFDPSPQKDPKPQDNQYVDDGCEIAPSCLSCPLAICRHDDPWLLRRHDIDRRNNAILAAHQHEGIGPAALARQYRLSRRTIHRILKETRNEHRKQHAIPGHLLHVIPTPDPESIPRGRGSARPELSRRVSRAEWGGGPLLIP